MSRSISRVIVFVVVCVLGFGGAAIAVDRQVVITVSMGKINKATLATPTIKMSTNDTIRWKCPQAAFMVVLNGKAYPDGPGPDNPFGPNLGNSLPATKYGMNTETAKHKPNQAAAAGVAYEVTILVFDSKGVVTDVWTHNPHFFVDA